MSEVDLGWADVLRRAERRAPRRRLVLLAAVAAAALGGGPALGVLLTRPGPPQLPRDQIAGPVSSILDPRNQLPLVEYGRWEQHDGVCYLVPHVHAGCLLAGHRAGPFSALPYFTRLRHKGKRPFILIARPRRFFVLALPGGAVKLVKP
jgi:hypothetical protein